LIVAGLFAPEFTLPPQSTEFGQFANTVVRPHVIGGLGALLFALVMESVEFPAVANERPVRKTRVIDDIKILRHSIEFRTGVAVLAVYSAGLSFLWGSTARYARHVLDMPPAAGWVVFSLATWCLCAAGRIAGTALMGRIDPMRLLAAFAVCAAALCLVPAIGDSVIGLGCMLAASFFISIMFPTIFARTVKDLGPQTAIGAGILVAGSGLGGLFSVVVQRALAGFSSFVHISLAVAGLSMGLVLLYAVFRPGRCAPAPHPRHVLSHDSVSP
jgi:FHS family L-fucose permease-like MFS transporter